MNLWQITITNPDFPIVSARVAADTSLQAEKIARERIQYPDTHHPVIIAHMGIQPHPEPGVVQITTRGKTP